MDTVVESTVKVTFNPHFDNICATKAQHSAAHCKHNTNMFDYLDFDQVFEFDADVSYESATVEKIEANRKSLEGLFVDKVLKLMGIKRRVYAQATCLLKMTDTSNSCKILPTEE